jgi:hypothetical protein
MLDACDVGKGQQGPCSACYTAPAPALHAVKYATGRWALTADACYDVHHMVLITNAVPA